MTDPFLEAHQYKLKTAQLIKERSEAKPHEYLAAQRRLSEHLQNSPFNKK